MPTPAENFNNHPMNDLLKPWVESWKTRINAAKAGRKGWDTTVAEIRTFYDIAKSLGSKEERAKWDPKGIIDVRFQMRMSKAFEMVAIYGPQLFWKYPQRIVELRPGIDVIPDLFQDQQQMQMAQQQQDQMRRVGGLRAELQERVLNWLPTAMPGTLATHGRFATTDSIVSGRGLVVSELYYQPDSQTKLCGSFYVPSDRVWVDPDCTTPDWSDAYYIIMQVDEPRWIVEKKFGLPSGALKGLGSAESADAFANIEPNAVNQARVDGYTRDIIRYYKTWTKCGTGVKSKVKDPGQVVANNQQLLEKLDETVGDYQFLCILPNCKYPLNLPGAVLAGDEANGVPALTPDEVKQRLSWPTEEWRMSSWPVSPLDYYPNPQSPYPLPPLGASLGWIRLINLLVSCMADRAWSNSRDVLGVNGAVKDVVEEAFKQGGWPVVINLDLVVDKVGEALQYLQPPPMNRDVLDMLEFAMAEFEKSSGLNGLSYGQTSTQDRSAAGSQIKAQQTNIRVDDMASRVEDWMTTIAQKERLMMFTYLKGQDVLPLLGQFGAYAWDHLVASQPVEAILREFDVTVEAHAARKPNKARETENAQQGMQVLMPVYSQYAAATGNMGPLNELIKRMCSAMDWDPNGLMFQPPPPPDPAQQQQEQQAQQMQQAGEQAKVQATQTQAQAKMMIAQLEMQRSQQEHALKLEEMQAKQQAAQVDLAVDAQRAQMEMQVEQQKQQLQRQQMVDKVAQQQQAAQIKQQQMEMQAATSMGGEVI